VSHAGPAINVPTALTNGTTHLTSAFIGVDPRERGSALAAARACSTQEATSVLLLLGAAVCEAVGVGAGFDDGAVVGESVDDGGA